MPTTGNPGPGGRSKAPPKPKLVKFKPGFVQTPRPPKKLTHTKSIVAKSSTSQAVSGPPKTLLKKPAGDHHQEHRPRSTTPSSRIPQNDHAKATHVPRAAAHSHSPSRPPTSSQSQFTSSKRHFESAKATTAVPGLAPPLAPAPPTAVAHQQKQRPPSASAAAKRPSRSGDIAPQMPTNKPPPMKLSSYFLNRNQKQRGGDDNGYDEARSQNESDDDNELQASSRLIFDDMQMQSSSARGGRPLSSPRSSSYERPHVDTRYEDGVEIQPITHTNSVSNPPALKLNNSQPNKPQQHNFNPKPELQPEVEEDIFSTLSGGSSSTYRSQSTAYSSARYSDPSPRPVVYNATHEQQQSKKVPPPRPAWPNTAQLPAYQDDFDLMPVTQTTPKNSEMSGQVVKNKDESARSASSNPKETTKLFFTKRDEDNGSRVGSETDGMSSGRKGKGSSPRIDANFFGNAGPQITHFEQEDEQEDFGEQNFENVYKDTIPDFEPSTSPKPEQPSSTRNPNLKLNSANLPSSLSEEETRASARTPTPPRYPTPPAEQWRRESPPPPSLKPMSSEDEQLLKRFLEESEEARLHPAERIRRQREKERRKLAQQQVETQWESARGQMFGGGQVGRERSPVLLAADEREDMDKIARSLNRYANGQDKFLTPEQRLIQKVLTQYAPLANGPSPRVDHQPRTATRQPSPSPRTLRRGASPPQQPHYRSASAQQRRPSPPPSMSGDVVGKPQWCKAYKKMRFFSEPEPDRHLAPASHSDANHQQPKREPSLEELLNSGKRNAPPKRPKPFERKWVAQKVEAVPSYNFGAVRTYGQTVASREISATCEVVNVGANGQWLW